LHEIPKENGRDVGHAHGRAGMAAFGLLHCVHGKKADAVCHVPQVLVARLGDRFDGRSGCSISHDCRFLFREIDRGKGSGRGFAGGGALLIRTLPDEAIDSGRIGRGRHRQSKSDDP
jgi:hypothetical protein